MSAVNNRSKGSVDPCSPPAARNSSTKIQKCPPMRLAKGAVTVGADSIREQMIQAHGASKSLEAEYIRSLHKQIYLLELENKYIREEFNKSKIVETPEKPPSRVTDFQLESVRKSDELETLRKRCQDLHSSLDREVALRKEQLDIFTQDLVRAKSERDAIMRENKEQRSVIEDLQKEIKNQVAYVDNAEQKFASLKQALSDEMRKRKVVERKLQEQKASFRKYEETMRLIGTSDNSSTEIEVQTNKKAHEDIIQHVSEIYKQMKTQEEEIKTLKEIVCKDRKSTNQSQPRKDDNQSEPRKSTDLQTTNQRKRWQEAENTPAQIDVQEDPIEPTEKLPKPSLKL